MTHRTRSPQTHRGALGRRLVALVVAIGMLVPTLLAAAAPAGAQVAAPTPSEPPVAGHNISVFPSRDFVNASGYPESTTSATVEVFRGAVLTGRVPDVVPIDLNPNDTVFDGVIEINHPGAHCWGPLVGADGATAVTPDIRGGDVVRVTYTYVDAVGNTVTAADQITVSRLQVTQAPTAIGPDTIEMRGTAQDGAGRPLAIGGLVAQVFNKADPFELNGRPRLQAASPALEGILTYDTLNNPAGINWTATFTGLSAADVARADGAEAAIAETFGLTGFSSTELGQADPAGPAGGCIPFPGSPAQPPLDAPVATAVEAAGSAYVAEMNSAYYPAVPVGATGATKSITIRNTGAGATGQLHVTGVTTTSTGAAPAGTAVVPSAAFTYVPAGSTCVGATVPVGGTCVVNVRFSSAAAAYATGTVTVQSDSARGAVTVNLRALAVGATSAGSASQYLIQQPGALNMGTRAPGVPSAAATTWVVNLGAAASTTQIVGLVQNLAPEDNAATDFAVTGGSCGTGTGTLVSVPAGGRCTVLTKMTPTAGGARHATLRVNNVGNISALAYRTTALSGTGLAAVSVTEPPRIGWSLGTFPGREFVSITGAPAGTTYTIQLIRHGEVVSQSGNLVPEDLPTTPIFDGILEVNHPGAPCWEKVTPDVRPGDRVRVVNAAGEAQQTYVANVSLFPSPTSAATAAVETAPGTVQFHGRAVDEIGRPYPASQVSVRLITSTANPFDLNGRRSIEAPGDGHFAYDPISASNPDGTRFTATFTGLSAADVDRAMNQATQRANWLGRTPAILNELTLNEFGAGVEPGCIPVAPDTVQPPLEALTGAASPSPSSLVFAPRTAGTGQNKVLTIRNTGPAPMTITGFTEGGPDTARFTTLAAGDTCSGATLAPDATCAVTVRFAAGATVLADTVRTATLQVVDDVAGLLEIPLSGKEVLLPVPYLTASTTDVVFPDTQAGTSATIDVTITNEGQQGAVAAGFTRSISSLVPSDATAFSATGCTAFLGIVAANNTCTLTLRFTPPVTANFAATANLNYAASAANGGATGTVSIPMTGRSRITADGYNDPPVDHFFLIDAVTDSAQLSGYDPAREVVDVEVLRVTNPATRATRVIGTIGSIIPDALGNVTANWGVGGACFAGPTPDLRPGDIVRATAYDISDPLVVPPVTSREESYVQDIETDSVVSQTDATTVVVTGTLRDVRTGVVPTADAIEVRLPARGAFFSGGRALLSTRFDGIVRIDEVTGRWTATFRNLPPADVALARATDPVARWLGRDLPEAFESTLGQWNQPVGAQLPTCVANNLGEIEFDGEPAIPHPVHDAGFSGVGTAGGTTAVTVTNAGNAATTLTGLGLAGLQPGDFRITGGTCAVGTVLTLAARSCTVVVTFTATALGERNASLKVSHTGYNPNEYAAVRGTGISAPILTGVAPATAGRGMTVTLTGRNFQGVTGVTIAGVAASGVTTVSPTTVTALVPTLPTTLVGPQAVTISTVAGTAPLLNAFTYVPDAPAISALVLPVAPVVAGTTITVQGAFLSAVTSVTFGGITLAKDTITAAPAAPNGFRVNLDGTLTVTIPAGAPASSTIVVSSAGGSATSVPVTVVQPPTITAASVASGRAGTAVTFTCTSCSLVPGTTTQAVTSVTFPGATAPVTVASAAITRVTATSIRLTVPAGALPGPVTVTGPAGSTVFRGFTVLAAPVVTRAFDTAVAGVLGTAPVGSANQTVIGRTVTVTGAGFTGPTGASLVTGITIGATRVATITNVTATSLQFVVPARTPVGAQAVAVTTGGGTGTLAATAANVTSGAAPTVVVTPGVTSFTPLTGGPAGSVAGGAAGTSVTVTGTNLQYASELRLAGRAVPFTRVGAGAAQQLRFTVPAGSTTGAVSAVTLAGVGSSVQALRVLP